MPELADWRAPSARPGRSSARRQPAPSGMSALDQLLAYEQIRQLAARYALAVNMRDLEALTELFVADVRVGRHGSGRAALRQMFARHMDEDVDVLEVTTHVINLVDSEHATGTVYSRCELGTVGRWARQSIAYEDEYERREGLWYFTRRDHLLFYGMAEPCSPLDQQPAHWPRNKLGRGSVPYDWSSWQAWRERAADAPDQSPLTGDST